MLIRAMFLGLALLPLPVAAREIEENEALMMRLIFDDCLGFVTGGAKPFTDLESTALTLDDQERLGLSGDNDHSARLIENRTYAAVWGLSENVRTCVVGTHGRRTLTPALTFRATDFFAQLTLRADAEGLVDGISDTDTGQYGLRSWIEAGVKEGEGLTISLLYTNNPDVAGLNIIEVRMPLPDLLN